MRPLGWNAELLGESGWHFLERHVAGHADRFVGGEAALAGFWFHHREVARVEVILPDQASLDAMVAEVGPPQQTLPGFARYERVDLVTDHLLILDEDKPLEQDIRADTLRDLAADRLLRLAGGADPALLVDLYFLQRARVDLSRAAKDAASKDLGLTSGALAVVLARARPTELPPGLVRPVDLTSLQDFVQELIEKLGMEIRG